MSEKIRRVFTNELFALRCQNPEEFHCQPCEGVLRPFEKQVVNVTFTPTQCATVSGVMRIIVDDGRDWSVFVGPGDPGSSVFKTILLDGKICEFNGDCVHVFAQYRGCAW